MALNIRQNDYFFNESPNQSPTRLTGLLSGGLRKPQPACRQAGVISVIALSVAVVAQHHFEIQNDAGQTMPTAPTSAPESSPVRRD
jgi:hypothetical protein